MAIKVGDPIWVPPSASALIGGETLPPLILNAIGTRYFIDARLDGSIQDGSIDSTTKGAPTLTLSVLDPDGEMLNSDLFTRRIDLVLDNVPFRLVQVSRQEDDLLSLEFEHRLCSWLREHKTPRKASRGTKTRAEFAYSLVLEVKKEHVVFISPDMHKKQARAATAKSTPSRAGRDGRKAPGFSSNATGLTIKGSPAKPSQLKEVDKALGVAAGLNASPLATKAMIVAGIGESSFVASATDFKTHTHKGVFQSNQIPQYDTELMAHHFLVGGRSFLAGGAMGLSKQRPPLSPGMIAIRTEVSDASGAGFYDRYAGEAQKLIDAWRGASSGGLSSSPAAQGSPKYEFTRGAVNKGDADEDSWMALQRLADEVRWRCFIDGRNVMYFVSDEQLMRSRPLYLVDRETASVRSVTFDMEVGKRTVIYKGRREFKPSEAILKVRMGRWAAPPGSVIELADYGLADGRWIVDSMSRGIFDAEAEVHLRQPQKALREPAAGTTSGGGGGSRAGGSLGSGGDGTAAGTYTYPMGSGLSWGRIDMGVDFAGAGVIKAAGKAKVTRVAPQGSGTGWPGAGDGGRGNAGAMIVIQLMDGSLKGRHIYLAENIDPVGGLSADDVLEAGQVYAHARGQFPYLEIGWASNPHGTTLASATTGYSEGQQTVAGKSFAKWLHYLESRQGSGS